MIPQSMGSSTRESGIARQSSRKPLRRGPPWTGRQPCRNQVWPPLPCLRHPRSHIHRFWFGLGGVGSRVLLTGDGWFCIAISRCGRVSELYNRSHVWVGPNQGDERLGMGQSVHGMGAWVLDLGVTGVVAASAGSTPLPM